MGLFDDDEETENTKIDELIEKDLYEAGVITFCEDLTQKSIRQLTDRIKHLAAQKNEDKEYKYPLITIHLTSNGGSVYDFLKLYDLCVTIPHKIRIVAQGYVFSAGALIMACCGNKKERIITKNTSVMLHQISSGAWGKFNEIEIDYEETRRLHKLIVKLLTKHSKMNKKEVEEMLEKDTYLTAKKALELGLVDKVI